MLILLILLLSSGRYCPGPATSRCYTFVRNGDLQLSCSSMVSTLTHTENLTDFAIDNERRQLIYGNNNRGRYADIVVELESGKSRELPDQGEVFASCGQILSSVYPNAASQELVKNPLTGERISYDPYVQFRCSSDRKVVLGLLENGRSLHEGSPPRRTLVSSALPDIRFDISPSGSYIAYFSDYKLCVEQHGARPDCVRANLLGSGLSVNNQGEVLFSAGTGRECFFKDGHHFSSKRMPGYEHPEECVGIGYWRPGLLSIQILEPVGEAPQWIQPDLGRLLLRWATRSARH